MTLPRRRFLLATALLYGLGARAQGGVPPEVGAALPGARLQGSGRLRYFGLHVYDARLWSGAAAVGGDWAGVPFALELEYARSLDGAKIADRSLAEMRRQEEIAAPTAERWLAEMKRIFPDVRAGDRLTGVQRPGQGARFHINGAAAGEVPDAAFARLFFGIWLSPRTSEPALRTALLGAGTP
jgi:hypothetical protein